MLAFMIANCGLWVVDRGDLGAFRRQRKELQRYLAWSADIRAQWGSVSDFVLRERLGWDKPALHAETLNNRDYFLSGRCRILVNDWPYYLAPGIRHLVVWTMGNLEVWQNGRPDQTMIALIEEFVGRVFVDRITGHGEAGDGHRPRQQEYEVRRELRRQQDRVLWFMNWTGIKSIPDVSHFHVLVRDIDEDLVQNWVHTREFGYSYRKYSCR